MSITDLIGLLSEEEVIFLQVLICVFILLLLKKLFSSFYEKKIKKIEQFLIPIIDTAVLRSAKYFNSESGQRKLEEAVDYVQNRIKKMPIFLRIFFININKKTLVDMIEKSYSIYKEKFNSNIDDKELDIKGNEIEVKKN